MCSICSELSGLRDIAGSYEKWACTAEDIAEEAAEITRQLEQCRVRCHGNCVIHIIYFLTSAKFGACFVNILVNNPLMLK